MKYLTDKSGANIIRMKYIYALKKSKKMRVDKALEEYVETEIIPVYRTFDPAHGEEHVRQVVAGSLRLAESYDVDCNMVYAAAAYHDSGLTAGREKHHIESGRKIRGDRKLLRWFTPEQIETIAQAAEDHRASSAAEPRTIYGKIIAEADRDIEPEKILRRTVQYGLSAYPALCREGHYGRYKKHLLEKYAEGGYLKLWVPESDNAAKLEALRSIIADETELRRQFDRIFTDETSRP